MTKVNTDSLLTVKDFASKKKRKDGQPVTKQYIYNLINTGKLTPTYIGGIAFLDKSLLK